MKFKNSAVIFSLVLIFSIFSASFVFAFSPFVLYCDDGTVLYSGECNTQEEIWNSVEPSKGGFFDKLKISLSKPETKLELEAVLVAGQIKYLEESLEKGNYKEVRGVANEIKNSLKKSGRHIGEFGDKDEFKYDEYQNGVGPFYDYRYTKPQWTYAMNDIDRVKEVLLAKVEAGELTQEDANEMLDGMTKESGELSVIFQNKETQFIGMMVENSDTPLTKLEIEYELRYEDSKWGLEDAYYNIDRDKIASNKYILDSLKKEIINSEQRDFAKVDELFMQARMAQQDARDALVNEDARKAYENFHKAEYLIGVIREYDENGESVLREVNPIVDKTFEEINQEVEEENKQIIEDYTKEGVRETIAEKYPEYKTELDRTYDEAVKINDVTEKIAELEETKISELENAGATEEEAKAEFENLATDEYFYADGGKDYPVGYVEFIDDNGDGIVETHYGGGWMKGIPYTDYSSNFDYVMGIDGFTIQSPLTETPYLVKYPANYEPERFVKGDESFEYKYKTEEGEYSIEYIGEGMILHKPDGTSEFKTNYADISPIVDAVGGTQFRYGAAGIDVISGGVATRWTVNPVFGNYEDLVSGKNFVPEFPHYGDIVYTDGGYEYTVGETRVKFNPDTNTFEINGVTTIAPPIIPDAPVGFENNLVKEQMITEHGEVWTYDKDTATWTSVKTDEEGKEIKKEIVVAPNELYRYDVENDKYIDTDGEEILEPVLAGEKWEEVGGKWISEKGIAYDPVTGITYNPKGDAVTEVSQEDGGSLYRGYGTVYDGEGNFARKYTYATDGRYIYNPTQGVQGDYVFMREGMIKDYDYSNPPSKADSKGATWTMSPDGRWYTGTVSEKIYTGYENYYQSNAFAEVGRKVNVEGKEYFVDAEKGWATRDEKGEIIAMGPPMGQPSSVVNMQSRGGYYSVYDDYDSRLDRNYNYVADGKNYYFPSGMNPETLTQEQKEKYSVNNARGYDPAFNTCYGDCSAGGYSKYTSGTGYGNIQQADGSWKQATTQAEVDAAQTAGTYTAPGSSTTGYYSGEDYGYGYRDYSNYGSYSTGPTGYFDSSGTWIAPSSSSYTTGTSYSEGYGTPISGGYTYSGGTYDEKTGTYTYAGGSVGAGTYDEKTGTYTYSAPTGTTTGTSGYYGGYYTGGGGYDATGKYVGGEYGGYSSTGTYTGGNYYSSGAYATGGYPTGTYDATTGTTSYPSYYGSYPTDTAMGTYSGYAYDSATGTYVASGTTTSGTTTDSTGTTYKQNSDGTWSSSTSTSTSASTDTSTSTKTSTSTDTSSSSESAPQTTAESSTESAPSTGGIITDTEKVSSENWFRNFWKKLFG